MKLCDVVQTDDWKNEKHVPAIDVPAMVSAGDFFDVTVSVGKEIPHPNTVEHHIMWIDLYFKPDGDKFVYHVGHADFNSHGASTTDAEPVHAAPFATFRIKVNGPGTLMALEHCNIHGLWENSEELKVS